MLLFSVFTQSIFGKQFQEDERFPCFMQKCSVEFIFEMKTTLTSDFSWFQSICFLFFFLDSMGAPLLLCHSLHLYILFFLFFLSSASLN